MYSGLVCIIVGYLCYGDVLFPWCSGYHMSLTHSRSPVRYRAETLFVVFFFTHQSTHNMTWMNRPPLTNVCISIEYLCYGDVLFPWCNGYHVSLTHSRSPVRYRAETLFVVFFIHQSTRMQTCV